MPTLRDGAQVMKGLSLVVDQYLIQQTPGLRSRASSAAYHANELLKILLEQAKITASQRSGSTAAATSSYDATGALSKACDCSFDSITNDSEDFRVPLEKVMAEDTKRKSTMRAEPVPSTQVERLVGFGSLFAKMAIGRAAQQVGGVDMTDRNAEVLAESLCRMRGAALKVSQMLSVQDDGLMPCLSEGLRPC